MFFQREEAQGFQKMVLKDFQMQALVCTKVRKNAAAGQKQEDRNIPNN